MISIELHKKVVEKKAVLPDHAMVRIETYYRSLSGYMNFIDSSHHIRGVTDGSYMLVTEDGAFFHIEKDRVNGDKQTKEKHDGQLVAVHARLALPAKDWDWYPCKWKSGRLVYTYKEQDFVEEHHELVVGEIVDIFADDDEYAEAPNEATVVLSRPGQIVVESDGVLIAFNIDNMRSTGNIVSDCGDHLLVGKFAVSEYDEELHS